MRLRLLLLLCFAMSPVLRPGAIARSNQLPASEARIDERVPIVEPAAATLLITPQGLSRERVTVRAGDTVTWTNQTATSVQLFLGIPHTLFLPVTLNHGAAQIALARSLESANHLEATADWPVIIAPGASATRTFSEPGTIQYFVTGHPGWTGRVSVAPAEGLPDPGIIAPLIDPTVSSSLPRDITFIYDGDIPIQTGMPPGTIDAQRGAVIRGKVMTRDGNPLPGVEISIHGHSEYGRTESRADGWFDMAVNGGGPLIVDYVRDGYLPLQRQVEVPWRDFALLPEVAMIALDPLVTTIELGDGKPAQAARGSIVDDEDGTRQATLLFPQGTAAELVLPDGTRQPMTSLNLRATEYTVGARGPQAMPAALPPTSDYTYAVAFTADEALAAGATTLRFDRPIAFYVENFLGFPTGIPVPVAYHDRASGQWMPVEDGRIIKIIRIANGRADIDTDGDGTADDGAALGITDDERRQLASLYQAGQSLSRFRTTELTNGTGDTDTQGIDVERRAMSAARPAQVLPPFPQSYDLNYGSGPPPEATQPNNATGKPDPKTDKPRTRCGSIIECENQVLGEVVGVDGTPFALHYQSDRVAGRRAANTLEIPLSGDTVPSVLKRIELEVLVAGRIFTPTVAAMPNQSHTFEWDGLDVYGRELQGQQAVNVHIGYVYDGFYNLPPSIARSFGFPSGIPVPGNIPTRRDVTLWQGYRTTIGAWDARGQGLGGWSLDVQHVYDPIGQTLYMGDGTRRSAESIDPVITTVAGIGTPGFSGDGGPATQAQFDNPSTVDVGPDGSLYITDNRNNRIRKVDPKGIVTTVAGTGVAGFSGDGGPATQAQLNRPYRIRVGPDGSLLFTDNLRIRRVSATGIITTVIGTGVPGFSGDGGPAISAQVGNDLAAQPVPDGSIYLDDNRNLRIRRVAPDGTINTIAGDGTKQYAGEGVPATRTGLDQPTDVVVGPDGSVYVGDVFHQRIMRIGPDGIATTLAGTGVAGSTGDGGPAVEAQIELGIPFSPVAGTDLGMGPDGSVYFTERARGRVRRVGPDGIITTVAGNGTRGYSGDNGPATQAQLRLPLGLDVGPDGSLYIADAEAHRIRRVAPPLPGFSVGDIAIASEDGSEIYQFGNDGRHLRTLNALTGGELYRFTYNAAGRLAQVVDGDGNGTLIERASAGQPSAIIGPFGQRTLLSIDANGTIAQVTAPAARVTAFTYTADGLMTSMTDARGSTSRFDYDDAGRLTSDRDAAGGMLNLSRIETTDGYTVTVTTALNRATTHEVTNLPTGVTRRVTTEPDGTHTVEVTGADGSSTTTYPDGTVVTTQIGPDPRWGMTAPVVVTAVARTPGGIATSITTERTATLVDPNNPLSMTTQTETATINGKISTMLYTAATRTFSSTSPLGRRATATIDAQGRVTREHQGDLNPIIYSYDAQGRIASMTSGAGADARTASYTYTSDGYLESASDALERTTTYAYDAAGNVTGIILPGGRVISGSYDATGNLLSVTPPGRTAHSFAYTPIGLGASYTPPDVGDGAGATAYDYTADRELASVTRPDGKTMQLERDAAGRMHALRMPERAVGYRYDPVTGSLMSVTTTTGIDLHYTYDGFLPTMATVSGPVQGSVSRQYDSFFRPRIENIAGTGIDFVYDDDSLLRRAGELEISRDSINGLITSVRLSNSTDQRTYNAFGEQTQYAITQGGAPMYSVAYTYDKLGRISRQVETIDGVTTTYDYTYDLTGSLTIVQANGATLATYAYDLNGNRTAISTAGGTVPATYDAQDRLLTQGTTVYEYTQNGEVRQRSSNGQAITFRYDTLGQLIGATLPNNTQLAYLLDGHGRRVGKRIGGNLVQGFLYRDTLSPVAELDGQNNVVSRFIYGSRSHVPDYMIKGGATYRIIADHRGSPRLVIDATTGAVAQRLDYDAFGNVTRDTQPGFQPFGFAGGLYDRDTGLVHFGAREYDPATGRWTAKDPILFDGGNTNLYGYVLNDPINFIDPSGLKSSSSDKFAEHSDYVPKPDWDFFGNKIPDPTASDKQKFGRQCEVATTAEREKMKKELEQKILEKTSMYEGKDPKTGKPLSNLLGGSADTGYTEDMINNDGDIKRWNDELKLLNKFP